MKASIVLCIALSHVIMVIKLRSKNIIWYECLVANPVKFLYMIEIKFGWLFIIHTTYNIFSKILCIIVKVISKCKWYLHSHAYIDIKFLVSFLSFCYTEKIYSDAITLQQGNYATLVTCKRTVAYCIVFVYFDNCKTYTSTPKIIE